MGPEIRKCNSGFGISSSKIPCMPIFWQNGNFNFFVPYLPKNEFWGWNFENINPDSESVPRRYEMCQFSGKTNNFDFFGPNLPINGFWDRNFENLSSDSESTPPRYPVCQFSGKTNNFEFLGQNLGKLPNYAQYFGFHNVESVAESWVKAEMRCVGVGGAGWSWVVVD